MKLKNIIDMIGDNVIMVYDIKQDQRTIYEIEELEENNSPLLDREIRGISSYYTTDYYDDYSDNPNEYPDINSYVFITI